MKVKQILKLLVWLLAGYLIVVGLLTIFQNQLIFHPVKGMIDSPERLGTEWSEHWIKTSDGLSIHGWMIGDPDDQPVVVYSHGNAGNISGRVDIAGEIAGQGAAIFMYDYRGYGKSDGSPTEQGIYKDGEAVVHYLRHHLGIPEKQMIFYGRSLGAAVAARQSAEFGGSGLVLDSAFINGKEIASDLYPFIPPFLVNIRFPVDEDLRRSNAEYVMVMHATGDRIITVRHGRKLFEYIPADKTSDFIELEGGHNDSFIISHELFAESWKQFLRKISNST